MTENHGVPGSNPGPAASKSAANSEKIKGFGSAAGALCQNHVNSRFKKWSLLVQLWQCRGSWALPIVEPGAPHLPPRNGSAFLLPAPGPMRFSYVQIEDLRGVVYIRY